MARVVRVAAAAKVARADIVGRVVAEKAALSDMK
jgi:hypothetical protein